MNIILQIEYINGLLRAYQDSLEWIKTRKRPYLLLLGISSYTNAYIYDSYSAYALQFAHMTDPSICRQQLWLERKQQLDQEWMILKKTHEDIILPFLRTDIQYYIHRCHSYVAEPWLNYNDPSEITETVLRQRDYIEILNQHLHDRNINEFDWTIKVLDDHICVHLPHRLITLLEPYYGANETYSTLLPSSHWWWYRVGYEERGCLG